MKIKNILLSGVMAMSCLVASAQDAPKTEYVFNPHWYVQGQIGAQYTLGELKFGDLISPNIQLGVGRQFSPVWGARFSVNFWQSKGGINLYTKTSPVAKTGKEKYDWSYVAPMIDGTLNLSNALCGYNPNRVVNVGLLAGIGLNIGFGNDDAAAVAAAVADQNTGSESMSKVWDGTKVRLAGRVGANVDFRIDDQWSVGVEATANVVNDGYNSKSSNNSDWYFNALVGVRYNIGKTYSTRTITPPAPVEKVVERIVEKIVEVPAKQESQFMKKATSIRREVFFTIGKNIINAEGFKKLDEVAAYMKECPEATVTVTGYADRGTGSQKINDRIAARRADIVETELVKRGVARDRIIKSSKGSRVQPFSENNKNRVTICIAEDKI